MIKHTTFTYKRKSGRIKGMRNLSPKKGVSSQTKLADLIKACIAFGADSDGKITKTKLAKLVYLSDFNFYYHNLIPITGVTYAKFEQGPVSYDFFNQLLALLSSDKLNLERKGKAEMFSLVDGQDFSSLNKEEIKIIQKICSKWKNKKTEDIVKFTHDQIPWKISFNNGEIPYSLIIQQDEATLY